MKVKILIFDTETTGKAKNFRPAEEDLNNYPYLVQYCGQVIEVDLEDLSKYQVVYSINCLVQPIRNGKPIHIEEGAYNVHHISEEKAAVEGNDIAHIAMIHQGMCSSVDFVVAHNWAFDRGVIVSELLRLGIKPIGKKGIQPLCTMRYATGIMKLPNTHSHYTGWKYPNLAELYKYCTGRDINEDHQTHDAQGDTNATIICLLHLMNTQPNLLKWFKGEIKGIY